MKVILTNNPADTVTSGGAVQGGNSTFHYVSNFPAPETLYEISPRKYSIKLEKRHSVTKGDDFLVLYLKDFDGEYTRASLVELLLDLTGVVDRMIADDEDEEDDIEEDDFEEEEDDVVEDTDVPPPPSRSKEQADGTTFCGCSSCRQNHA